MASELSSVLSGLIRPGVSDIFVTAGKVPSIRENGTVTTVAGGNPVTAAAVDLWRGEVLDERGAAEYLSTGGADAAVELNGRRCRVNFLSSLNGPVKTFFIEEVHNF